MQQTILVDCQVIEKEFTRWDKAKRWGRSISGKAKDFFSNARDKIAELKDAIALFLAKLLKTSKRYSEVVSDIFTNIKEDWNMGNPIQAITNFLLGPPAKQDYQQPGGNYTDFQTSNAAEAMVGAVQQQNGFISEEQLDQFQQIGKNSGDNLKRIGEAIKIISKVSSDETEVSKLVYQCLNQLERNAYKRSEHQQKRRQESQILAEKFSNLRKGL